MSVSGLIRFVSLVLTAIVAFSFLMFAWDELGSASKHQVAIAAGDSQQVASARDAHGRMTANENDKLRIRVDKANDALTSPGESIGKRFGDGDPWAMRVAAFAFGMLAFLIGLRLLASWIQLSGKTNVEVAPRDPQDGFTAGSR